MEYAVPVGATMGTTRQNSRPIQGLGEVVLRVRDLDVMQLFYEQIIGLELLRRFEDSTFFRIASGYAGHTQVLALFKESIPPNHPSITHTGLNAETSTLHHVAFAISSSHYESERACLQQLGLEVRIAEHKWVQWRSLYVSDPEGNVVELVCYDPSVR